MPEKIIWSPASEDDLGKILQYLAVRWNQTVLLKFIDKIDNHVNLIKDNPTMFPLINNDLAIRKCVITKHNTLYYRVSKGKIEIIRIFDTRQDPDKLTF